MQLKQIKKISQVTQEVTLFLRTLGFSNYYIIKIYDLVGDAAVALTEDNPYWLLEEFPRMGFKKADEAASILGIAADNPMRIEAAVRYVLASYLSMGHSFAPFNELSLKVGEFIEVSSEKIRDVVEDMVYEGKIQMANLSGSKAVYFYSYYKAECDIAGKLAELAEPQFGLKSISNNIAYAVKRIERDRGLEFSERQKRAVEAAISTGVSIITGGPGTGKTTVINALIAFFEDGGLKVSVAAPTGRAAKRIMETSGHFASTVHRLLDYYYDEGANSMLFGKNCSNQLEQDVIIIDETSMLDLMLMRALLDAVKPGTRLIFAGDYSQLPSVGAGNVLKDLIDSELFSVTELDRIYRQSEESSIVANANRINRGEYPEFISAIRNDDILGDSESIIINCDKQNDILERIVQTVKLFDTDKVQILTPTKKGILGTQNLNTHLQKVFNPANDCKEELAFGETVFRVGDRVMQNKNDYSLELNNGRGVFNGEIGTVKAVNCQDRTVTVLYDDNRWAEYPYVKLDEIEHAYAVTIHKSQGSEFPVVIIPMTWFPEQLSTRSLIYTGVTRAKNKVIVVGKQEYFNAMVDNNQSGMRNSGLRLRLTNLMEQIR